MTSSPRATVRVALPGRSYDVTIGQHLTDELGARLRPLLARPKIAVVTDATVAGLHLARVQASLSASAIVHDAIVVPAGESSKSFPQLAVVCDRLLSAGIERNDAILALGGGVIGDLAGFAAAILRRGVSLVQVPTTLLAQVDSSVGGKTGINSPLGKNLIGAFHQPAAVFADISLLDTLPERQLRAGYAEVVKYGLLGDRLLFDWLEKNGSAVLSRSSAELARAIVSCCEAKARIVARDETEAGERALLNLGHTFAHALEAVTGYSDRLLHGEAVATGMAMAFRLSAVLGHCPAADVRTMESHLAHIGLATSVRGIAGDLPGAGDLLDIMHQDKKARGGKMTLVLVRGIGRAFVTSDVTDEQLLSFLQSELGGP
ncbi:MAG: 3-dehydroquinate synthase [Pseudomonadota bacterium]|nr:3-dehydroquinate synthase [Pseudomonadota bacterium]